MNRYCLFIIGSASDDRAHHANDDRAIRKARSKKPAIKKCQTTYDDFDEANVFRVKYDRLGIAVSSDYGKVSSHAH